MSRYLRWSLAPVALAGLWSTALAQQPQPGLLVLPSDKTDADLTIELPAASPKASGRVISLQDEKGAPLSPLPVATEVSLTGTSLKLHIAGLYFWGTAKLIVQPAPGLRYVWALRRGPSLAISELNIESGSSSDLWLYNFDPQPLTARWRIVSGTDSVCGIESTGQPRRDCAAVSKWSKVTIGPAESASIPVRAPDAWLNPWHFRSPDPRDALLEMRFGADDTGPLRRVPLKLFIHNRLSDAYRMWFPIWALSLLSDLFWITVGAGLLMLAQVMIPNYRRILVMEGQLEDFQARLRAISFRVGTRLYTRCDQELNSLRIALAIGERESRLLHSWDRFTLSGNSTEVNRGTAVSRKIESRVALTERLDELQSGPLDLDLPPSLCWNREKQTRAVQEILARQFVTEAEEKTASELLDSLDNPEMSLKAFATDLEARITALRRQMGTPPWAALYPPLIVNLPGCAELLKPTVPAMPDGGWTASELALRDLCAVRLEIIYRMILLGPRVTSPMQAQVLGKLTSGDPGELASARADLVKTSQGIFEPQILEALLNSRWDVLSEPTTVTDQDVMRVSFVFSDKNKDLNHCAALKSFVCWWRIESDGVEPNYESGWDLQFVPRKGNVVVTPQIFDAQGNPVTLPNLTPATDSKETKIRGTFTTLVGRPAVSRRLARGLLDAALTALVPVVTVALTQVHSGQLGIEKLVLLGFTSQAIKAAVIPESFTAPKTQSEK